MQYLLITALLIFGLQIVQSQTTFSLGAVGLTSSSSFTTQINVLDTNCLCGQFDHGSGYVSALGLEAYTRTSITSDVKLLGLVGVSTNSIRGDWREPGAMLPSVDPDDSGKVAMATTEHQLTYSANGIGLTFGLGIEYGMFSITPIIRATSVRNPSTAGKLNIVSPEGLKFHLRDGVEYENDGRTWVLWRLPSADHRSLLLDAGVQSGITLTYSVLGMKVQNSFQAFILTGVNDIHTTHSTRMDLEYGAKLFVGVEL